MYRSHLLSFLEYRTPAIYHAKREVPTPKLDLDTLNMQDEEFRVQRS